MFSSILELQQKYPSNRASRFPLHQPLPLVLLFSFSQAASNLFSTFNSVLDPKLHQIVKPLFLFSGPWCLTLGCDDVKEFLCLCVCANKEREVFFFYFWRPLQFVKVDVENVLLSPCCCCGSPATHQPSFEFSHLSCLASPRLLPVIWKRIKNAARGDTGNS